MLTVIFLIIACIANSVSILVICSSLRKIHYLRKELDYFERERADFFK